MEFNANLLTIPGVLLFIGLEYLYAKRKHQGVFTYDNSIANISIGIAERLLSLFSALLFFGFFKWVYDHFALMHITNAWYSWIAIMLLTDFVWYWYHRLGHEINIFWAAHIVHHQSEDFNYTVAARITVLQALIRNVFYAFLCVFGFPPEMVTIAVVIHGGYSFFTHTQVIGKLGWLEYIFITPSHHRVHHASNEKYLDKNYGDIFTFWDRMFGTFQLEEEKPVYGLTHPLKSYSFLWQHFHSYLELYVAARRTPGLWNKVKLLLGKPDMVSANIRHELEQRFLSRPAHVKPAYALRPYVTLQIVVAVLMFLGLAAGYKIAGPGDKTVISLLIFVTLINCGAILEKRTWVHYLEATRILLIMGYIGYYNESLLLFLGLSAAFIASSYIFHFKRWYYGHVYELKSQQVKWNL